MKEAAASSAAQAGALFSTASRRGTRARGRASPPAAARLRGTAINVAAGPRDPVCEAAAKAKATVVCGFHELDSEFSGTTLFNSVCVIGPDGTLLNKHRKLMPTNPERMVWGGGDARGLRVVDTPAGRIGCLICWENYMPLARFALYAQNMEILVAPTWDCGEEWIATMKHIAKEGGCGGVGTGTALQGKDMPRSFPERKKVVDDERSEEHTSELQSRL